MSPEVRAASPEEGGAPLLTGNAMEDELRINRILRTIAEVNSTRDLDAVLASVVDRTLEHTAAERAILMLFEGGRLRYVCLLTDGKIGNEREILAAVRRMGRDSRLFSFGVGSAVIAACAWKLIWSQSLMTSVCGR